MRRRCSFLHSFLPSLPATVSLPVKLALFVTIDGWTLVLGSLAKSFGGAG